MPKTSFIMLLSAVVLGIVAVLVARLYLVQPTPVAVTTAAAVDTVPVVVATAPLAFADRLTADKLRVAQFPAGAVPAGAFTSVAAVVASGDRSAMRSIDANEPVLAKSVSGKGGRLSASGLIGANMRAVAVPVSDVSGVGGFLASGDRVDVMITRSAKSTVPPFTDLSFTDLLVANIRVLAVGQDADEAKSKPEVVRTATLEVSPSEAQKIALAQTAGTLSLSLRGIADSGQPMLRTVHLTDLRDASAVPVVVRITRPGRSVARRPRAADDSVEVVRGGTRTSYAVPLSG